MCVLYLVSGFTLAGHRSAAEVPGAVRPSEEADGHAERRRFPERHQSVQRHDMVSTAGDGLSEASRSP